MSKTPVRYSDLAIYRRLLSETRPYAFLIGGMFLVDLLAIPLALLGPVPLKLVVDHVLGHKPLPPLLNRIFIAGPPSAGNMLILAVILLVAMALLRQLQELASAMLHSYAGSRLVLGFRAKLFRHVQRLSLMYHDSRGSSDTAYRIQYDAPAIQHVAINGFFPLFTAAISLLSTIYVIGHMDWVLAIVALIILPILFSLAHHYRKPLRRRYHKLKDLEAFSLAVIQEALAAVRVVKAFGREDHEEERYLRHANEGNKERLRVDFFQGIYDLLVGLTTACGTAAVLFLGVRHVHAGIISLGQLLMIMAYLTQLYAPLRTISNKSADIQSSLASAERAFALLDKEPDVVERPHAVSVARAHGRVTFGNVSFGYDPAHPVLHNISFDIQPGSRVGIAGPTGVGKTTLVNLLIRFYDPGAGEIFLDGKNLRDYKLADLRNQFAIVLQDPVLFSTSIAENIAYAKPGASEKEIIAAAQAANAHEFIVNLSEGYETKVGERGMKLSGGERQRISLARAFLKDAPMLILDEPTSSVDVKTESFIMEAMRLLMQGRTAFMIAHRLSTLEYCDVRLNLDHGRLVTSDPFSSVSGSRPQTLTVADPARS